MKFDKDTCKTEYPDDNHILTYQPVGVSWSEFEPQKEPSGDYEIELTGVERVIPNLGQATLCSADALHYWFNEGEDEDASEAYDVEDDPSGQIAVNIARTLRRIPTVTLTNGKVPDWKTIRDTTTFINGPAFGDLKHLVRVMKSDLGDKYIHIDVDDIHRQDGPSVWTQLGALFRVEREAAKIIEDRICETFTTREALNYLNAEPDDKIDRVLDKGDPGSKSYVISERKWFMESLWLTDYLLREFPKFRTNFNVLIITGATPWINSGDLNVNQLYRLMARLGRVNTRIVFVG